MSYFNGYKAIKKADIWEEEGFKISSYVENLPCGALNYAIEESPEGCKHIIFKKHRAWGYLVVKYVGCDSVWVWSRASGIFEERL